MAIRDLTRAARLGGNRALKRVIRWTAPLAGKPLESNAGYCKCCRQETTFVVHGPWLRDQFLCESCGSIPRQRALNDVLDRYFPDWAGKDVHESSPSNDYLARWCSRYSCSQYFPDTPPGESRGGVRCEDLEHLTFPDGSFDLFITQDVFEHVFRPDLAAQEIARVLRPGGAHVFTAPKHKHIRASYPRARRGATTEVEHLLEAQYHGNPVGDGRALVTWDYGDDFEALLWKWCGCPTCTYVTRDRSLGLDGEYLEVFVTRKIDA